MSATASDSPAWGTLVKALQDLDAKVKAETDNAREVARKLAGGDTVSAWLLVSRDDGAAIQERAERLADQAVTLHAHIVDYFRAGNGADVVALDLSIIQAEAEAISQGASEVMAEGWALSFSTALGRYTREAAWALSDVLAWLAENAGRVVGKAAGGAVGGLLDELGGWVFVILIAAVLLKREGVY